MAQVDAGGLGARDDGVGGVAGPHGQGVEGGVVDGLEAHLRQAPGQQAGEGGDAPRDAREAVRAVVDGVHARHHRRQHLCRADVGSRLLAADVLLARLQRQAQRGRAMRVDAHADQPAGQRALVGVAAGQVGGMRAAVAHRHAQALRGAADDVGIPLARRHQQGQRQQVGRHAQGGVVAVREAGQGAQVVHLAGGGRVLRQRAEEIARLHQLRQRLRGGADLELDAQGRGACAQHLDGLRMAVAGDQEDGALGLHAAARQGHGLGRGGGLVEHRGIGDRHAREVAHHGLEVEQGLHAALRDLGLVGRVGRVPGRVLQDVAQDHARRVGAVVALPDEVARDRVLRRHGPELGQRLGLARRRGQVHRPRAADRRRHDAVDEFGARGRADDRQHARLVGRRDADVPGDEFAGGVEIGRQEEVVGWHGGHVEGCGVGAEGLIRRRRRRRRRRRAGPRPARHRTA